MQVFKDVITLLLINVSPGAQSAPQPDTVSASCSAQASNPRLSLNNSSCILIFLKTYKFYFRNLSLIFAVNVMEEFIVCHWLKQIYGEDVHPFEVNSDTVKVLKELFDQNKCSESGMSIILAKLEEMKSEFDTDASQLLQILSSLHLTLNKLPTHVKELLTYLGELSVTLKAGNPNLSTSYLLLSKHMIHIKDSDIDVPIPLATLNATIDAKVSQIEREILVLKDKSDLIKESVELEKENVLKKQSDIIFLQKKRKEYAESKKESEKKLQESEFREEISHPNISVFREEISRLEVIRSELRKRKHYYKALPLNHTLAKVKLEEAKLELKKLNQEILIKLNLNDQ